jgi:hypothetical protein
MDRSRAPFYIPVLFSLIAVIVAILLAPSRVLSVVRDSAFRLYSGIASPPTSHLIPSKMSSRKTPVYFLSHGGVSNQSYVEEDLISRL